MLFRSDFHGAKLASAGFYAAQILPRTAALARVITQGSALVADLDTALL